jgi:hypothetical protein
LLKDWIVGCVLAIRSEPHKIAAMVVETSVIKRGMMPSHGMRNGRNMTTYQRKR